MFRDGHRPRKEILQVTFNNGGIGDHIAYMSAVKYIKETFKFVEIHLFVPDFFFELAHNLVPGLLIYKFSDIPKYWSDELPTKQTKNVHSTLKTHLVDHGFHLLCDAQPSIEKKNYCRLTPVPISQFGLPASYCVVTTGFTAQVREMIPETVNVICEYLNARNITPVFLGSKSAPVGTKNFKLIGNFNNEVDYSKGIDLIDKTSLVEAGSIIAGAKAIVGLDCGLLHLAGTTSTPIVFGTTTVESHLRVPYRDNVLGKNCYVVEPPKSLKCRFCQSNWEFMYKDNLDFKVCFYKDYKCTQSLTADKYIKFLDVIL